MDTLNLARQQFAETISRSAGLRSDRLVQALREVPREDYLGPGPWKVMRFTFPMKYEETPDDDPIHLYEDVMVALDAARNLNNGLPSGLSRWIDAMDIQEGDRVVHAGCGTGYYTAVIAHMVGSSGHVTALEFDSVLASRAQSNLQRFPNVEVIAGDATTYDSGLADAILINAGATHPIKGWLDALKDGGRLVFHLVRWHEGSQLGADGAGWGATIRVECRGERYGAQWIGPAGIFPCLGAIDSDADRLLGEALKQNGLNGIRSLRREVHDPEPSCLLHGEGYCFSIVPVR
jgi:protein-L-isoaspartate(D-aspartate) O-methyltransferase